MTDTQSSRPPLDQERVRASGGPWREVQVVDKSPSTNAALAAHARRGAAEGLVLVAEHQTSGRGRLGRSWETPARAALTFSVLLRPGDVPAERWSWLPLLAGLSVVDGVLAAGGPGCALKWPNDVLCEGLKVAGILAERIDGSAGASVVLGIGLNVSTRRDELPVETATSLTLCGMAAPDRTLLLQQILAELGRSYTGWVKAEGDPGSGLLVEYTRRCETLGRAVRVQLPAGGVLEGTAVAVDGDGALVVEAGGCRRVVRAGDVVHLRAVEGGA